MSVQNFNPVLWEAKILKELDKEHMLVKECTTEWSGQISGKGSKVKINSIASPTIAAYTPNSTSITPEDLQDESRMLEITEANYFAFYLDAVDAKQTQGDLIAEGMRKAAIGLKDLAEQNIAARYVDAGNTITEAALTSANVFSTLMQAKTALYANNVSPSSKVFLDVSPYILQKIVLAGIVFTDNGEVMKAGGFAPTLGLEVSMSNNLSNTYTSAAIDLTYCMMRTKESVAYAEQIMKTVKYMPEGAFSDACKGLHCFGSKVIKPKELVAMVLTTAAESAI